eukprot:3766627-Pleurochrysis_carterae.AAC.2
MPNYAMLMSVELLLDVDYLGEVNNPDGLPGLYIQVPRMYRRVTRLYPSDWPVCQNSLGTTWYLAASRPTGNVVGNCELLPYLVSGVLRVQWLFCRTALCSQ